MTVPHPADITLARRLERAEASANAAFVESRAALEPAAGAIWKEIAGAYAMFDGVGSPLTQTFGIGIFDPFREREFMEAETFFHGRGASTFHEVSSFAAADTVRLVRSRGYTQVEESVVLVQPIVANGYTATGDIRVRTIDASECDRWADVSAAGWSSVSAELADFVRSFGRVTARARGMHCFVGELDGEPVATAALSLGTDVALLAGAATIPAARNRGAQRALFEARLAFAAAHGADLAMVVTQPGSGSQRNAERQGFVPAYTRTKWELASTSEAPQ